MQNGSATSLLPQNVQKGVEIVSRWRRRFPSSYLETVIMKSMLITAALVAAFAGSAPAAAQPASRTSTVSTAGLDLATTRGQRLLELRLLHAASDLCGTPSSADARGRAGFVECRDQARATAAEQVRIAAARATAVKLAAR